MAPNSPQPPQIADQFRFHPRWWWDPVPDWAVDHIKPDVLKELASIQLKTEIQILKLQGAALEESLAAIRKMT